jgi:hypothetical protein
MSAHSLSLNFIKQNKGNIRKNWNVTIEKEIDCKWKFSENGHLIVLNALKKREVIGSSQKKYSHWSWNLPIDWQKMPKVKLIIKFVDTFLKSNAKWTPPRTNYSIMNISIPTGFGILILVTKSLMFILQVRSNQLLSVLIECLNPME